MNFVKTIGIGIILGFIFGVLNIVPFCSCFIGPFIGLFGGFLLVKIVGLKQNEYSNLSLHLLVSSISGAIIGTILIYFVNMYQDPSFMSVVTSSSLSTSYIFDSIIFPFIYLFSMLFIFSGIGGLVNLFIKK